MEFDINDIEEVLLTYADGQEIVFRGAGLEKLRRLMKSSPPYRPDPPKKSRHIIEDAGSGEESGSASEEPETPPPKKHKSSKTKGPSDRGGYNTVDLNYAGPTVADVGTPGAKKGLSPYDLAKELQRQASATSKIKY